MTGKSGWYERSEISAFFYYPNQAIFTAPGTADKKNRKGTDTAGDLKHTTKYKH
ncbi:hypothetical protein JL661_00050 [Morganella morganii]|uniref:hypothetical protein n=1 Tax=Morganella morganii TaxID=582 RepID=UPI001C45BCC0|nr:hypothetical protein [Morganella morganii]QXO39204.1 hypothetical protein JL661_00050 [Morganella morganii]